MDEREQFERNLEHARVFFTELLDRPIEKWPPSGATIVPRPAYDPELSEANDRLIETGDELDLGRADTPASGLGSPTAPLGRSGVT